MSRALPLLVVMQAMLLTTPSAGDVLQQPVAVPGRVVVTTAALNGTVPMAGVDVELHLPDGSVLARTTTDVLGQVTFPDVPPGRYVVRAARPGFVATDSAPFDVQVGDVVHVLVDLSLTFVAPNVEVRAPATPAEIAPPIPTSDMLAGSVLDVAPLYGDDFHSLLPLLPGVVRGPDGRLRAKGGQPAQAALQISSTSLSDPSTGEFDLQLPGQSLESVELLANPYAAEYGRFSTSIVQIRTRRGGNAWEVIPGNLVPRLRKGLTSLRAFEPRLSVRGPLITDRLFLAQDFQFRYVSDPVRSLPDEPTMDLTSFDSFTRLDGVLSPRHSLGALMVTFPRRVKHVAMDTFRPPEVSPTLRQSGISLGIQDRFALSPSLVLETTIATRLFDTHVDVEGSDPMVFTPETLRGSYFNDQERDVGSFQWVETLTVSTQRWRGQHLFKFGTDVQHSEYTGASASRPVEVRRLDGSLAERTVFGTSTGQLVSATELAVFAQDRWRVGRQITLEFGLRIDRDDVIKRVQWSPRSGISWAVLPEGRGILRAGIGRFQQRTPLNVGAFEQFESRTITQYGPDGEPVQQTNLRNVTSAGLHTPQAVAGNVEWNQRFARRLLLKVNYLRRGGDDEYVLDPDPARGELRLSSAGHSKYSELELTVRYVGGDRRDLTASYVRSRGTADLNGYDQFYGNVRHPIVRDNAYGPIASDVPHRLLVRGTFGLPGAWLFAPVFEVRSGFPWSAVDEGQVFVGPRNRTGRLPQVRTLDFSLSRAWRVWKYRFNAGVRVYNVFGSSAARDVQNNLRSPNYGRFFNPLERSIGVLIGAAR